MSILLQDLERMTLLRFHGRSYLGSHATGKFFEPGDIITFVKSEIIPVLNRFGAQRHRLTAILSDGRMYVWDDYPWTEIPAKPILQVSDAAG